jgi:D-beta-D-heptose 7-phosphate kinase/D-beta-D-heptose 1-phosphate adenosyltransferase
MGQFLPLPQILTELQSRRRMSPRKPPRVVFTNGCFDILHVGHLRYLQDAKALGDLLIVGVNSDASVRGLKGPERPVNVEAERGEMIAGLGCVDFAVLFSEPTPERLIEALEPDVLVKGGDWAVDQIVGSKFVLARGGEVKSLPFHPGKSTTGLINKILKL